RARGDPHGAALGRRGRGRRGGPAARRLVLPPGQGRGAMSPAPLRSAAPSADPPGGRRALAVWGIGVSVYFVAVIFRTSLGVAGLAAADRFGVNASALSTFSILQLLVYAGMQIPVGLLVDRLGTKR